MERAWRWKGETKSGVSTVSLGRLQYIWWVTAGPTQKTKDCTCPLRPSTFLQDIRNCTHRTWWIFSSTAVRPSDLVCHVNYVQHIYLRFAPLTKVLLRELWRRWHVTFLLVYCEWSYKAGLTQLYCALFWCCLRGQCLPTCSYWIHELLATDGHSGVLSNQLCGPEFLRIWWFLSWSNTSSQFVVYSQKQAI
jgi:hypothetical protein